MVKEMCPVTNRVSDTWSVTLGEDMKGKGGYANGTFNVPVEILPPDTFKPPESGAVEILPFPKMGN